MLSLKQKYQITLAPAIVSLMFFAFVLFAPRKPKLDIKIAFHLLGCHNIHGQLVIKGDVVLKNNTDLPLYFGGRKLAENVNFVVIDNFFGKSHTVNGNSMYSISGIGIENTKIHGLTVLPRSSSESSFLTSIDGELQELNVKHIYCQIKIGGETYYSPIELLRLKE